MVVAAGQIESLRARMNGGIITPDDPTYDEARGCGMPTSTGDRR
jgi:hypothetical protein